jgi:hypothetical protein
MADEPDMRGYPDEWDMQVEPAARAEYDRIASLTEAALEREWISWTRCTG